MAISMQASAVGVSNYEHPVAAGPTSYQFYETIYTNPGPQEWIIMPSLGCGGISASITISFPSGAGAGALEATTSPSSIVMGTQKPKGYAGPAVYTLQDSITDITNVTIQGPTAIRFNLSSGSAMVSVRV